jgi:uncharacterized protein with GYD domain
VGSGALGYEHGVSVGASRGFEERSVPEGSKRGAAAGSVFGDGGGIWGEMNQARSEEDFLVEVHTDDAGQARRIAEILGHRGPLRLDTMAADNGLRSA